MLKWIESHPKSLAALMAVILGCLWIFIFDFSLIPLLSLAPFFGSAYLMAFYLLNRRKNKLRLQELDFREYREHQEISLDAIEDIFQDEKAGSAFRLPVLLKGICRGDENLKSPLSQKACLAYHLRVELLTPSDLSKNSYSYLLLNKDKSTPFKLQQDNKEITIGKGGFCQFMNSRQKNFTWSNLSRLPDSLKQIIEGELKLKNLDKNQFSGFRIIEEILNQGENCSVYGMCEKSSPALIVTGNHKLDHPESLTVTTIPNLQRDDEIGDLKKKNRRDQLRLLTPAVMLLVIPLYFFIQPKLMKSGTIYYQKADFDVKIEITDFSNEPGEYYWWSFGATPRTETTQLWNSDNEDLYGYSNSQLVISEKLSQYKSYEVGADNYIQWKGSYYYIEPTGSLPVPETADEYHKGRIYLKNKSSQKVKITFNQKAGEISSETYWTWDGWDGMKFDYGNYATKNIYDENDKIIEEREVLLETGDRVFLYVNNQKIRTLTLGSTQDVPFIKNTGWTVIMDDAFLKPRKGQIYYKNPSEFLYTVKILDSNGLEAYAATWDLEAGKGMDEELGRYLIITDSQGNEEDVFLEEGMMLRIGRIEFKERVRGRFDELPQAEYDYFTSRWTIDPQKR